MLVEHDSAGIAAVFDDGAQECGNGYAALGVDRVQSAALEKMFKRHVRPLRSAQEPVRGRASSRAPAAVSNQRVSPPALRSLLVTQGGAGYNGILWDIMGNR